MNKRTAKKVRPSSTRKKALKKWSKEVTEKSNALDLEPNVFNKSPKQMALSLKRSAEQSRRRKTTPFRSAMSMLNFYQNRAGRNLKPEKKEAIMQAKEELRKLYGRQKRI
jgi:hypothetical protein